MMQIVLIVQPARYPTDHWTGDISGWVGRGSIRRLFHFISNFANVV